jgi:hypothetical protein
MTSTKRHPVRSNESTSMCERQCEGDHIDEGELDNVARQRGLIGRTFEEDGCEPKGHALALLENHEKALTECVGLKLPKSRCTKALKPHRS